jgi:hypothetical protein
MSADIKEGSINLQVMDWGQKTEDLPGFYQGYADDLQPLRKDTLRLTEIQTDYTQVGLALPSFISRLLASFVLLNTDTHFSPRYFAVKAPLDDSQYDGPCN